MTHTQPPSTYNPLNDKEYMSKDMLAYFKAMLIQMNVDFLNKENSISLSIKDAPVREPDPVDQGINEELHNQDFDLQRHVDKIRHEIEAALERINKGTYGYCEETGEVMGVKRLLAIPYARYCLSVEEEKERDKWNRS